MALQVLTEQVDEKLSSILQNFQVAVHACDYIQSDTLKSKLVVEQERLAMANASNNIVQAVESLLSLTAELKQKVLLNNVAEMNCKILEHKYKVKAEIGSKSVKLDECRQELDQVMQRLYSSLDTEV
jgi:Surfeit locus protein 5 subunit 22 of Mediator complex